jgi:hypothetical protein
MIASFLISNEQTILGCEGLLDQAELHLIYPLEFGEQPSGPQPKLPLAVEDDSETSSFQLLSGSSRCIGSFVSSTKLVTTDTRLTPRVLISKVLLYSLLFGEASALGRSDVPLVTFRRTSMWTILIVASRSSSIPPFTSRIFFLVMFVMWRLYSHPECRFASGFISSARWAIGLNGKHTAWRSMKNRPVAARAVS